jgi:hypothetical protein
MTRVFCGRQRQPTRFRHYLTGAQLTVGMIGIAVSWLGDPTASLTSYLAALHAIAMAPIPSALGPRSRIWPTPPDGTLGNRGQPYRRPAAGDAGTPYFVATLTATRSWLYGVLCYSPHMGCWLFYWPSRTHCYLIEGPHNPALRDPGAIDAAQQWAAVFLDEEHALNSLLATDSTRPVTSVTEWIAIEWNGRPCWVPLFADTDLCSLPISARHDNTGTLHHCRCRHANAAMTCEPTTLAGRRSAEKDHDGPAC